MPTEIVYMGWSDPYPCASRIVRDPSSLRHQERNVHPFWRIAPAIGTFYPKRTVTCSPISRGGLGNVRHRWQWMPVLCEWYVVPTFVLSECVLPLRYKDPGRTPSLFRFSAACTIHECHCGSGETFAYVGRARACLVALAVAFAAAGGRAWRSEIVRGISCCGIKQFFEG